MSPITHFLVSWVALEQLQASRRDKALVVLAGIAPDLDGLGIVVDFATKTLGLVETDYYQSFHRMYGHGLPAALVIAAVVSMLGIRRYWVAFWAFVSVHLHFLCDLLGSRGTTAEDIWGIYYFAPLTTKYELSWATQWPLVGWQNMVLTAVYGNSARDHDEKGNDAGIFTGWIIQRLCGCHIREYTLCLEAALVIAF